MANPHERIIVKYVDSVEYYETQSKSIQLLHSNNNKILTTVTKDGVIFVGAGDKRITIYKCGEIVIEKRDTTKTLSTKLPKSI